MQFCLPIVGLPLLGIEEYRCYKERKKEDSKTFEGCLRQVANIKTLMDSEFLPFQVAVVETISALFLATMFPVISTTVCLVLFGQMALTGLLLLKNEKLRVIKGGNLRAIFQNNIAIYLKELKILFADCENKIFWTDRENDIGDEDFFDHESIHFAPQKKAVFIDPLLDLMNNKILKLFPENPTDYRLVNEIWDEPKGIKPSDKLYPRLKEHSEIFVDLLNGLKLVCINPSNLTTPEVTRICEKHLGYVEKNWGFYMDKMLEKLNEENEYLTSTMSGITRQFYDYYPKKHIVKTLQRRV
ncbi:MAG: hypothetical protein H0W88_07940 [Parachlamydiaceae bacterium]|nr:hypothetical protein [Parachlamydiaceae bacterium]